MGTRDDDVPHEQDERESLRRRIAELEAECARLAVREQELAVMRGHSDQLAARLRALYDESPRPIGFSRHGVCIAANAAYLKLLGFESADEFVGRSVLETIAPSARAEMAQRIESRERGLPVENHYETRGRRKDGSEFPCEIHITRIEMDDGPISAFFVENVDKRMQAEEALTRSEARFRGLVEGSRDATAVVDPSGKVIYTSPNAAKLTGYPFGARDGKSILDTIHPEDRESAVSALRRLLGENPGSSTTLEFRGIRQDGSMWWGEATATNLAADPNIGGVVVNYRDITERKNAEEEKRQLQEQLHQAQKMEAIGTLAGGIAHDFNNILGGVLGGLSLLELELGHTDRQGDIDDMKELVRRGAELARQLLGFSRRGKYNVQPLDVREVVSKTAAMFGRTHRDIVIEQTFGANLQAALMDHVQLEQVLLNLFLNAAHAMPDGGWLRLQAENAELGQAEAAAHGIKAGRFVKMVVADSGTGIDPATLPRIFEPFFTTKAPGQGSGLGLASVYGIIKNHGGMITVESEVGRGTTFTIFVPATEMPVAAKQAQHQVIHAGHGTVLVVDDEERVLHLCSRLLEAMGYRVLMASGGRAAVEMMRRHQSEISLVILDLTMPEMSGAKTFEALREISPTVKVLLASGASPDGQAQELLNRGCNGFLQKPFDAATLSEKIQSLR